MLELWDGAAVLHVGGVAASAEYASYFHCLVRVRGGDEGPGGVVYDGGEGDGEVLVMCGQQEMACSVSSGAPFS